MWGLVMYKRSHSDSAMESSRDGGKAVGESAQGSSFGGGRRAWWRNFQLETETSFFILVNVLDFMLTFLLLWSSGHTEANPIARYFLDRWGFRGMLYFKLALVALVCVIAQIVAVHRPGLARGLLIGSTAIVGAVVIYSATLLRDAY